MPTPHVLKDFETGFGFSTLVTYPSPFCAPAPSGMDTVMNSAHATNEVSRQTGNVSVSQATCAPGCLGRILHMSGGQGGDFVAGSIQEFRQLQAKALSSMLAGYELAWWFWLNAAMLQCFWRVVFSFRVWCSAGSSQVKQSAQCGLRTVESICASSPRAWAAVVKQVLVPPAARWFSAVPQLSSSPA